MAELALLRRESRRAVVLSLRGVVVRFGALQAVSGVSLDVEESQLVAIAGENGAGKTTLVRAIAGDLSPAAGEIVVEGRPLPARPQAAQRLGIAVVRQESELCDNLDIAANLFLGAEGSRFVVSDTALHRRARALLSSLGLDVGDTRQLAGSLSGGKRQLLTLARALVGKPRLLVLDEPTASLGVAESAQVEQLIMDLHRRGVTILLVSHDVDQILRLADRIVVLRHGSVVADVDSRRVHRDDVVAMLSGQRVESSARRQLTRLQNLVDQLASADPSSSLSVILSALGAALGTRSLCIHLQEGDQLRGAAVLGIPPMLARAWQLLPFGEDGGPIGLAAATEQVVVAEDLSQGQWGEFGSLARQVEVESCWSVPVMGSNGFIGVISIFSSTRGRPQQDELDLAKLYAGYAASAIERDRLLSDVTARNRVLETIRDVLETLAGPVSVEEGPLLALRSLRRGLQALEVALFIREPTAAERDPLRMSCFLASSAGGHAGERAMAVLRRLDSPLGEVAAAVLADGSFEEAKAQRFQTRAPGSCLGVPFRAPRGPALLVAYWRPGPVPEETVALLEDAAHSLQLALEREELARAHQETAALRRSQEMQRAFLSRLSHELRTPLTAIRGYASSLLQPDVSWDLDSQQRFLGHISTEAARLGRLVEDLLDFSAIETGVLRLQSDWCDLGVVLDAAVSCLPASLRPAVEVHCEEGLLPVWADHDRLEQVVLNLLDNALRHNPPGTKVRLEAKSDGGDGVIISVTDDGLGVPEDVAATLFEPEKRRRSPTAGSGLGLSIAKGIVEAHGGQIGVERMSPGLRVIVRLPVEGLSPTSSEKVGIQGRV